MKSTQVETAPTHASATFNEDTVFAFNSGLFPFTDADSGDTFDRHPD